MQARVAELLAKQNASKSDADPENMQVRRWDHWVESKQRSRAPPPRPRRRKETLDHDHCHYLSTQITAVPTKRSIRSVEAEATFLQIARHMVRPRAAPGPLPQPPPPPPLRHRPPPLQSPCAPLRSPRPAASAQDPSVGKETLERAALQVKISDTRVVRAPAACPARPPSAPSPRRPTAHKPQIAPPLTLAPLPPHPSPFPSDPSPPLQVAAKFVVAETEARLRSAASAGIKTIVEAMVQHPYNPDVQQAGCKALSDLAVKLKGSKEEEAGTQGMRAAIQALRCVVSNPLVQQSACVALSHLAPLVDVTAILGARSPSRLNERQPPRPRPGPAPACPQPPPAISASPSPAKDPRPPAPLLSARAESWLAPSAGARLRSLQEGSEAVTCVIGEYTANAAVLTHACRALVAILRDTGDQHARARALQANGISAVVRALGAQPRFAPLHEVGMELLAMLVKEDADREACWGLGGAQLAVASIATHPSLVAAVQHGCCVLEKLCNTPQRAEQACALDAIAIVLTAVRMHRAEVAVQIAGATCLKAMIVTATGKARAAKAGAMEAVAVAIFGHADDLQMQISGARLIKSLAVQESVRSRPTAAAAIEGLCSSLSKHRGNAVVAAEGTGALCNLCIDQPANRRKLAECGAAESVVAVMRAHMCAAFPISPSPTLAPAQPPPPGRLSPSLLPLPLASAAAAAPAIAHARALRFRPPLRSFNVDVQEAACAALWVLGSEPGSEVFAQGGPAAIVEAMKRYPKEVALQTVACAAFKAMTEQPGAEARAQQQVERRISRETRSHPLVDGRSSLCPPVGSEVGTAASLPDECFVLDCVPSARPQDALVAAGALPTVLQAVRSHGSNASVQHNGMEAVVAIASLSTGMKREALDEGAVELCRSAMTLRFSSDAQVTAACERVLDVLEGAVWITTPSSTQAAAKQAAAEQAAAEQAAAEQAAAEQAAAEQAAAEQAAAEQAAVEQAADQVAVEQALAEQAAVDQAAAE